MTVVAKSWDRFSIVANTRPNSPKRRNVTQEELLVPAFGSKLELFAACAACGAMISVLSGFGVTFVILSLSLQSGAWSWWAMLSIGVVSTLALFAYASWERKHDHEWLERF